MIRGVASTVIDDVTVLRGRSPAPWPARGGTGLPGWAVPRDAGAQHWLGWRQQDVVPERRRERLLDGKPCQGGVALRSSAPRSWWLVAVDPEEGRLAGAAAYNEDTGEVGGWLAPRSRGRGLGASLFAGAAQLAHNLAVDLRLAGRAKEALRRDRETYAQRYRDVLGDDALATLRAAKSLAVSLRMSGLLEEAHQLTEDTNRRYEESGASADPRLPPSILTDRSDGRWRTRPRARRRPDGPGLLRPR